MWIEYVKGKFILHIQIIRAAFKLAIYGKKENIEVEYIDKIKINFRSWWKCAPTLMKLRSKMMLPKLQKMIDNFKLIYIIYHFLN